MSNRMRIYQRDCEIPQFVLREIIRKFFHSAPPSLSTSFIPIMHRIEQARWHFIDVMCPQNQLLQKMKNITYRRFAEIIFKYVPYLRPFLHEVNYRVDEFCDFLSRIPTYGAMLLNKSCEYVLLVQNLKGKWGFPKGKIEKGEESTRCAIREVFEETGYNIEEKLNPNDYLEHDDGKGRICKLFAIRNVEMNFKFETQSVGEIKMYKWFAIADLPEDAKDLRSQEHCNKPWLFELIFPFIRALKDLARIQRSCKPSSSCKHLSRQSYQRVSTSTPLKRPTPSRSPADKDSNWRNY